MFDLSHVPGTQRVVFGPGRWHWLKPRGANFVHIMAIGAGGGGGGGRGGTAGSTRGGGGGGASAGYATGLWAARHIKSDVSVTVNPGGAGGAGGVSGSGSAGTTGYPSFVSVYHYFPSLLTEVGQNTYLTTSPFAGGAQGGLGAGGSSAGAGGNWISGTPSLMQAKYAMAYSYVQGAPGLAGSTGNLPGNGQSIGTGMPILPGCGGAGVASAQQIGGGVSALANSPFTGSPGGAAGGGVGNGGFVPSPYPLIYGGTGGGSSNSIAGGHGGGCGNAYGAGGGGGGAGVTNGGRGGNGGPGLVVISWW